METVQLRNRNRGLAVEANQRIACLHRASHIPIDEIPRITDAIERDVAMIYKSTFDA